MRDKGRIAGMVLLAICNAAVWAAEPATQGATAQGATTRPANDVRLYVDARINDQPVRLAFDTGAEDITLFRPAVDRLKINVTDSSPGFRPPPGQIAMGVTEKCQISIDGKPQRACQLRVVDISKDIQTLTDFDGVVGWYAVRKNILHIRLNEERRLSILTELPKDIDQWTKFDLLRDFPNLVFQVPCGDGKTKDVLIDTGDPNGVGLSAEYWKKWRSDNAERKSTMAGAWTPAVGFYAYEECWAEKFVLGTLSVLEVPVTRSPLLGEGVYKDCQAMLGLFALTRLDIIADWKNGSLYVRPEQKSDWVYSYNRLGAVFMPGGNKGGDLVAHVADRSQACNAGILNDDILLKIDDLDVTNWQMDPTILPLSRFWCRPASTKLRLTLGRNGKSFEVIVELKEIFDQKAKASPPSRVFE